MDDVVDKPTLAYLLRSSFESERIRKAGWWLRPPHCRMYDTIENPEDSAVFDWYVDLVWDAFSREYYR